MFIQTASDREKQILFLCLSAGLRVCVQMKKKYPSGSHYDLFACLSVCIFFLSGQFGEECLFGLNLVPTSNSKNKRKKKTSKA